MDKYNIYLFISNSVENFKLNQYWNFWADSANKFSFYEVFRKQHRLQSVPYAIVLCIYWSQLWKIENAKYIQISSEVNQSRMWNSAVITHANTSNGINIFFFFFCSLKFLFLFRKRKSWGMILYYQCSFDVSLESF